MPRKRIMQEFRINEISSVDSPAQEEARVAIMKRAEPRENNLPDGTYPLALNTAVLENVVKREIQKGMGDLADLLTSEEEGHQHGVSIGAYEGSVEIRVMYSQGPEAEASHDHPVVRSPEGQYTLGMVAGHTHAIDQEAMSGAVLALVTKTEGGEPMTTQIGTQPTVEELGAQLARAHAVVALTGEERAHFEALPEEARTAFLAKSADDRKAEIGAVTKAAQDANPVVFTAADGTEFRKSDDPRAIAMAKRLDATEQENAALKARDEQTTLEKRAGAELPHLPGDVKTRAAMLKAIDGIEDEAQREAALGALKAQNEAMSKAFQTYGHGGQPEPGSPADQLDKLAKVYAEKNGGTFEAAYMKVADTPEGQALYKQIRAQ